MSQEIDLRQFLNELASKQPTPGGGGASALAGAMSAALCSMVCNLTIGKKKYLEVEDSMKVILDKSETLRAKLTDLIDRDAEAFQALITAFKLPKESEEEVAIRSRRVEETTKKAALVPLEIMRLCCDILPLALAATKGNEQAISDTGVSAILAAAGAQAAALNVHINLPGLRDREWAKARFEEVNRMLKESYEGAEKVLKIVSEKISR
jgi:formiminotetrahydrofolate cyclodeaminase